MLRRPLQLGLRFAHRRSTTTFQFQLCTQSSSSTISSSPSRSKKQIKQHKFYSQNFNQTINEGPSWVTIIPQHVTQSPRERSQYLRAMGQHREAHAVLRRAGILHSRNPGDLIEYLLVLQHTDEFSGPHQRLSAMLDAIWAAPIRKPKKVFRILLNACVYEASNVSDNAVIKLAAVERATEIAWHELRNFGGRQSTQLEQSTIALIYRICGYCRALNLANRIRDDLNDPINETNSNSNIDSNSSEDTLAEYILCLGKCGKPVDAERLFFSHHNRMFRSSPRVLASLFQSYLAARRISKAEALISIHGASFLDLSSCNVFIRQCTSLRLFDTALSFLDRMERSKQTGFPSPVARTYNILLHGLSSVQSGSQSTEEEDFEQTASDVVSRMKQNSVEPTTVTYNTLIRSYVLRDKIHDAMILFRSMSNPDHITFSHLMQGAANVGDADIATNLLQCLKDFKQRPTYGFCKSYLHVMAAVHGVEYAQNQAHDLVDSLSDVFIFGDVGAEEAIRMSLIHACGKVGDLQAAFRALSIQFGTQNNDDNNFEKKMKNSKSDGGPLAPLYVATVLMQACLDCDREGQALEVFESVKSAGLKPNFEVYESLIKGLCSFVRKNTQQQRSTIDNSYSHVRVDDDDDDDDDVELDDNNTKRSRGFASNLENDVVQHNEAVEVFNETMHLVREMHDRRAARSTRQATFMYNLLITAAAGVGEFDLAFEIFRRMSQQSNVKLLYVPSKNENKRETTTTTTYNADSSSMKQQVEVENKNEDDEEIGGWSELLSGCQNLPPATVNTYNSMMGAAWRCGRAKEGVMIFERMQMDRETEPNEATLGLLADIGLECSDDSIVEKILLELDRVRLPQRIAKKRAGLRRNVISTRWSK